MARGNTQNTATNRDDELLPQKEVARVLAVQTRTIGVWIGQGRIEAVRLGRTLRIRRGELYRFMRANTIRAKAQWKPNEQVQRPQ